MYDVTAVMSTEILTTCRERKVKKRGKKAEGKRCDIEMLPASKPSSKYEGGKKDEIYLGKYSLGSWRWDGQPLRR